MDLSNKCIGSPRSAIHWCVLPGASTIQFNRHFQEHFNGQTPDSFDESIIFMFMFNDIEWTKNDNADICLRSAKEVVTFAAHFKPRRWCFLESASRRGGTTFQFSRNMRYFHIANG